MGNMKQELSFLSHLWLQWWEWWCDVTILSAQRITKMLCWRNWLREMTCLSVSFIGQGWREWWVAVLLWCREWCWTVAVVLRWWVSSCVCWLCSVETRRDTDECSEVKKNCVFKVKNGGLKHYCKKIRCEWNSINVAV